MTTDQNIIKNQPGLNSTNFDNSSLNSSNLVSIFWFTEAECTSIAVGFLSGALIGSFLNSSVLVVLCHVLYRDAIKSGSDFLIAVLTSLDLCATTLVFVLEGFHFLSFDCNEATSDFLFALTFFLESSSAFSLLNVALFRYSKICLVNIIDVDFKHTVYMSIVNILVSVTATILALFCNNPSWHALAMMTYLLTIFLVFILMGVLYFTAYWALRKRSQQARLRNAKRHNFANMTNYNAAPIEHQFGHNGNSADQHQGELEVEKPTTSAASKVKIQIQPNMVEKNNNAESSPTKTAIELMTERSAKVFIAITLLYFVCFMPNAILTFLYLVMGPELYKLPLPPFAQVCDVYCSQPDPCNQ